MNFKKLLTSCREGVLNQAFNRDNHGACARQTNVEEPRNGVKRTLAKPMNNKHANEN